MAQKGLALCSQLRHLRFRQFHLFPQYRRCLQFRRQVHSVPRDRTAQMGQAPCLLRQRLQCLRSHQFRLLGLTVQMAHSDP